MGLLNHWFHIRNCACNENSDQPLYPRRQKSNCHNLITHAFYRHHAYHQKGTTSSGNCSLSRIYCGFAPPVFRWHTFIVQVATCIIKARLRSLSEHANCIWTGWNPFEHRLRNRNTSKTIRRDSRRNRQYRSRTYVKLVHLECPKQHIL